MTGLVLAAAGLVLGEAVGPPLERYARQFRAAAKYGEAGLDTGRSAWIRDGDTLLNVVAPTGEPGVGGVYVFRKGAGGWLDSIGRADSVHVEPDGSWVLDNFADSRFVATGVDAGARGSPVLRGLNPDLLGLAVVREETLSGAALYRYIRYLQRNGLDSRRYEVSFWARISTALAVAVMCVLAVPFVLGALRSGGAGARMLTGLGIGLAWFLMARTLTDGGAVWGLSPLFVAWLPTTLLAVAAGVALARVR
jgi:lipopolysaccharide export system permease protein